ncbi:mitochondrial matrix Mmp37-domain-containing protein [Armillaria borealis]|uniref:Phosphatidate cytidylyltransferase, mitochondrial n=1 Tax=Armillaria borealis TaxID=47425 RepID=A0AA39MUW0_9AGAR|nr:mitochondrial matrix Mmp37-domain-containing protein [Armillaria borealis]
MLRVPARSCIRAFATESVPTASNSLPPPSPPPRRRRQTRLHPAPRPYEPSSPLSRPQLPPSFGRNQLLPVSNSTRALLESVVAEFEAPIRYAFAYGSGVFEQDGYETTAEPGKGGPVLDFMFAVTHPSHFHSINMHQFPSHYPLSARMLGSDYVSTVQSSGGAGVWFNAYVPMPNQGVTIKYGVTTVDNLCDDLLNWRTLYLAGRMHKPLRIIKDDARVRLTQQVNLVSALRSALLLLPEEFSERELFEKIAGISYSGDPRMVLPAENRGKVGNIVRKQEAQFKELYGRLVGGLPGVDWTSEAGRLKQDLSPLAREKHLRKLPRVLLEALRTRYMAQNEEEERFWIRLAADKRLDTLLEGEMKRIVRLPATIQTAKGLVSAGIGKSVRYSLAKVGKWWRG